MISKLNSQNTHLSRQIVRGVSVMMVSAIATALSSCASNSTSSTIPTTPQAQVSPEVAPASPESDLQVVTTFIPITQFTKAVVGDRAEVTQLMPTNVGPHDYQAKPEDAQNLAQADVLVKNGLEMELFLDDLVQNAGNPNLKVIDSSQGIATITTESIEGHAHAHDHDHAEDNQEAGHGHDHGEFNPHIWLDPKRAIQQVENIRDGLITADPAGKETYTANAAAYIQQLQALDAEIETMLQPFAGKTFIAFHDFAPYFAESYNLTADFLVDVPEENPSPEDVKRVIDTVKATNLKTLLTEPQGGQDAFAALSEDLSVRVSLFDPMETGGPEALQPEYYINTMRQNATTLVTAFTGQSTQSYQPLRTFQPIATMAQPVGVRF